MTRIIPVKKINNPVVNRGFSDLIDEIKRDSIQASFDNGILTITLGKSEEGISKTIEVK